MSEFSEPRKSTCIIKVVIFYVTCNLFGKSVLFFFSVFLFTEMCNSLGEDVAHGTLFLRPMRQTVRRGRVPRAGGTAVLSGRLLRHVRAQMRRMQSSHNGELCVGTVHSMAFQLLRVQGKRY